MKIIVDDKIPYIRGVLEPLAEVEYVPGQGINKNTIRNAEALIIRTRTRCNRDLLDGSRVQFIATATIGFDHIDTAFCSGAGISWTNAPGCNSESVNQYMASALTHWAAEKNIQLANKTIGIVGVGNVGSKVARTAEILGMNVLLNDPPRERKEGPDGFVNLKRILDKADIISLHVPLNMEGADKTHHLAGEDFFRSWKNPELLVNTCRGEVMDTQALLNHNKDQNQTDFIIDCWENEPDIDLNLLELSITGTPHIAGYSRDGKANGTALCIQALSRHFSLGMDNWVPDKIEKPHFPFIILNGESMSPEEIFHSAIQSTYEVMHDDRSLRQNPGEFEKLRGDYPVRREFSAFTIMCSNIDQSTQEKLKYLGFNIKIL